jgi:hypothetical protein
VIIAKPVKIFTFIILIVIVLFAGVSAVTAQDHELLSREAFDRWPALPEYTTFNPFPAKGGNCTWYAHGRMMQLGFSKYTLDSMRFDAYTWVDHAARGAEVTLIPEAASIAYWEAGAFYGSALGHVGVVEAVNADGSILISDSGSSGSAYRTYLTCPGDNRWPTAFITVPKGPDRSTQFYPGVIVQTTPHGLNFRPQGINQQSVLLPKGTAAIVMEHVSNGLYASQPGSTTSYHYWWFAQVELNGETILGWLAENYLEPIGYSEPDQPSEPDDGDLPEGKPELCPGPGFMWGDVDGDGQINILDITLAMQHALNRIILDENQLLAADVNNDGLVDIRDVVLIMQFCLALID